MTGKQKLESLPVHVVIEDEPIIAASVGANNVIRPAKQNAYLYVGKRHPLPFTVAVPEAGPYRPGEYLISGDIFRIGQYGLEIGSRKNLVLVPAEEALKALTGPALRAA